jgi:sec-independent protein translocase protein TatC
MSGALDEDTARTLASGRQTVGTLLSTAQDKLKRVFLVFVVGWLGTFYLLRVFVWDRLKADLVFNRLPEETTTEIVATDPFQVILLQIKIGLIVGVIAAIPTLVYYSRGSLKERGIWPDARISLWKKVSFVAVITGLFLVGLSYAYFLFFPLMFKFLATNAESAGFKPTWSIVKWTEFIVFLAFSFALAAQLPLAMVASARTGVVSYETFRDKWRYAVVGIAAFGAIFSPPDPFTQVMWGVPLVLLYFISLGITKLAVMSKRAGETVPTRAVARDRWNVLGGSAVLTAAAVYAFMFEGGAEIVNDLLGSVGSGYRLSTGAELRLFGLDSTGSVALVAAGYTVAVVAAVLFYLRVQALEEVARQTQAESTAPAQPQQQTDADPGESAEVDFGAMSPKAVEAAPLEAFATLSEQQALQFAQTAVDNENPQKARTILDRFEESRELDTEEETDEAEPDEGGNVVASTAAGMVDPFTEGDTDEDDIGGYLYDLQFIFDSLTSKAIWIVGVFMVVLAGSFIILFQGGIGVAKDYFLQNMPAGAVEEPEIVVLHPVEALIFMLKFSTVLAILSVLPITLYFAWPSIEQRFGVTGDRNVLLVWGGTMFAALTVGTVLGFRFIAPGIISLLAKDVVESNMIIAYRISSFGWLVIFLTVGVGALAMVPATMVLFHHGNIVSYARMKKSWRGVVIGLFAAAGFFSPDSLFTMFIVAIPASLAYLFGLAVVQVYMRIWP